MIDHNKPIQEKNMPIRKKKIKKLGTLNGTINKNLQS